MKPTYQIISLSSFQTSILTTQNQSNITNQTFVGQGVLSGRVRFGFRVDPNRTCTMLRLELAFLMSHIIDDID